MKLARLLLLVLFAATALADSRTYTVAKDPKNGAHFKVVDSLEDVVGTTGDVTGTITADRAKPAAATVELSVGMTTFDTGNSMRNDHTRRYLEASKFPLATFKSVSVNAPATIAPNQSTDITIAGDFTAHGVTKRLTVPVRVVLIPETTTSRATRGPGDWIHATATFAITMGDYGIHVPSNLLVTVDDKATIVVDVFAKAQ